MRLPDERIASCGDSCEFLISPIPRPRAQALRVSVRPKKRRVVFLDSRKPSSIAVLRRVSELLRAKQIDVEPEIRMKDDPSRPMESGVLDWIAREEGLLLCGIAD